MPCVVQPDDLGLEGMRKKVGELLPLRRLQGHDRLIAYLDATSQGYRIFALNG